jgi:platelet-activating factor acetylhydrolase IB subunit alpha
MVIHNETPPPTPSTTEHAQQQQHHHHRHVAILEYLRDGGPAFARAAEAFELDAGLTGEGVPRSTGLLEKKWTSVVRLQKKVLELEDRLAHAEQELKAARLGVGGGVGGGDAGGLLLSRSAKAGEAGSRNLPRAPAVRVLVGHRGGITCLTTHPVYGLLVSGSEDASIKVRFWLLLFFG